ncbi:MAG: MarR family transcriptional regulator [Methanoregula sp.]|jgi:DNA-binding MarR family transcriptional regulator
MHEETSVTRWIQEIDVPTALISYTYRVLQKKFSKELARYRIGWGHFIILMILYAEEGQSQDGIAQSRGFDKTMIAKSVRKLEEMGLVVRTVDPADRRVKRLYLTGAGRALCPEIRDIGRGIYRDLFYGFSCDESSRALEVLRKIALNAADIDSE